MLADRGDAETNDYQICGHGRRFSASDSNVVDPARRQCVHQVSMLEICHCGLLCRAGVVSLHNFDD